MNPYKNQGPATCDEGFDTSNVKGRSVVITGGANGIGQAYVKGFVKAGAYVTFGDIDEEGGKKLEAETNGSSKFVKCDVTKWDQQLALFKDAIANSSTHRVDVVVANAGIAAPDDVFTTDPQAEEPDEPTMKTHEINSTSVLYTVKLALHYFRRQFAQDKEASKDQLLVMQSSVAGYLDIPSSLQYNFSKFGLRAMMRVLRRTEFQHGIRVNNICPWFISTALMSDQVKQYLEVMGVEYATVEDAAQALLKLASDTNINGRAIGIFPRSKVKSGYADLESDDYKEGDFLRVWDETLGINVARPS